MRMRVPRRLVLVKVAVLTRSHRLIRVIVMNVVEAAGVLVRVLVLVRLGQVQHHAV